jgi:hypothetical protein
MAYTIRTSVGTKDILKTSVNDVVSLVENKEMACNALPSSSLSTMSSFRRQQTSPTEATPPNPSTADRVKEATCPDCKNLLKLFTEGARGWNTKPHRVCLACYRSRRRNRCSCQTPEQQPTTQATFATDPISQIAAFQTTAPLHQHRHRRSKRGQGTHATLGKKSHVVLDHHIFTTQYAPSAKSHHCAQANSLFLARQKTTNT